MNILNNDKNNELWDKIENDFGFNPNFYLIKNNKSNEIFNIKHLPFKIFKISNNCYENELWQNKINNILKKINSDMYALNWQHDGFLFNPNQNISLTQCYENNFPTYYPDGDYYLFISKDFSQGIFNIPGFNFTNACMFVFGNILIEEFTKHKKELQLIE